MNSHHGEFTRQQVQREVPVNWDLPEPAGELVQHETGREVGGVDGAAGGAGTGLSFGLFEERRGVMIATARIGGTQDAKDFAQHAAVAPEGARLVDGAPDRGPCGNRIHAAEDRLASLLARAKPVGNGGHCDRGVDVMNDLGGRRDFGRTEVASVIALRGDVGLFDVVEVHELQPLNAERGELQGHLATDGSDADDGGRHSLKFIGGNEVVLTGETVSHRGLREIRG